MKETRVPTWRNHRSMGFAIIAFVYVAASLAGFMVYRSMEAGFYLKLLLADVTATLIVWISSAVLKNASVYDPYWSVQPIVILNALLISTGSFDVGSILICAIVSAWGLRLTANWASTFQGLSSQDWRYDLIKSKTGALYQLVNLTGIQMMPTLIVFTCILPAAVYIKESGGMNAMTPIGLLVSALGIVLETVADIQMGNFRKSASSRSEINKRGLWGLSRHPNYLGEILMWWGVYIASLGAGFQMWHLGAGAVINTALFLFISIPLAERRLASYKDGYGEYLKDTPMLIPSIRRNRR